jgi:ABC-2 type transport system ATP-binding protein
LSWLARCSASVSATYSQHIDALALLQVSKRYRKSSPLALDDVSFSIPVGARACLLGPNGAGKSTSIRLLEGAIRPTIGAVRLLGAAVDSSEYLAARRQTGIVPQGPGMYTDVTAGEYLALARDLYGRGSLSHMIDVFGLGEHLKKPLAQLSGGFQRRVVLASALLAEPELLLLDEPTVGLDPLATHEVHEFLRQAMATAGRTTLLCTHNLTEAEALCEDVIILRDGHVLVHAALADLRRRARPRLRLRARQGRAALLEALRRREIQTLADEHDDGLVALVDDPSAQAPQLLRSLLADGLDIFACEPLEVGLEDVFLDLVRGA